MATAPPGLTLSLAGELGAADARRGQPEITVERRRSLEVVDPESDRVRLISPMSKVTGIRRIH
jgi:hypothetical protein